MEYRTKKSEKKKGYTLLLCLIFIGLLAMGSTLLIKTAMQKTYATRKSIARLKAQIIAEAGVYKTFAMIKEDTGFLTQTCPDVVLDNGSASISITPHNAETALLSTDDDTDEYLLTSTGSCDGQIVSSAVVIHFGGTGGEAVSQEVLQLFDGALFCGGDAGMTGASYIDLAGATAHVNGTLSMKGSANFQNGGSVSSSTSIDMSGGNAKINGDAAAPTIPLPSWAKWQAPDYFITGTKTEMPVPRQMIEIDLEPFRVFAAATDTTGQDYSHKQWNDLITDTYISEDEMPNNGTLVIGALQVVRPSHGILWVEGSIKFAGSSTVEGCVIATGDIEVLGGMTHKNSNGLPSFMSINGDLVVGSGCIAYGLIYAHNGDIKIAGDAEVNGAFICPRGDFTHCGSGKVKYDNSRPYGPNGEIVMLPQNSAGGGAPTVVGWVE